MGKHQLIIDNQVADVFTENDMAMAISFMVSNIANIEGSSNPTTKTIKLPGTNRNKRIFGYADDLNVYDFKGQKQSMIGIIREGGTDILTGVVNLKDVTRTKGEVVFNITIIGNSGEWIEKMKEAKLLGVDLGGEHTKIKVYIDYQSTTLPVIYGLINNGFPGGQVVVDSIEDDGDGQCKCLLEGGNSVYGLRDNFFNGELIKGYTFENSAYNKEHGTIGIGVNEEGSHYILLRTKYRGDSSGIFRQRVASVMVEDFSMLINVRMVLQALFALYGYTISSEFIETDFFKKLYFLPGKEKRPQSFIDAYHTKMGLVNDYTGGVGVGTSCHLIYFDKIINNEANMYNVNYSKFTATEAMHVILMISLNVRGTEGSDVYTRITINGDGAANAAINRAEVHLEVNESDYSLLEQEAELRLQAGDYVQVYVYCNPAGQLDISKDLTFIDFVLTEKIIKGSSIVPGEFLPDIKQLDFIKAIRHAFNLYFLTDISMKRVYIEPRNTFYKSDKYIDLTEKLDTSKPIIYEELGSDLCKNVAFRFKEDGNDYGVKDWEKINAMRYSTYVASMLNKFCQDGETTVENPLFAATLMAAFPAIGLTSMFPKIWQAPAEGDTFPEFMDEYEPRLLYYAGIRNCLTGESWKFEGTTKTSYPLFCSKDDATVNNNSLLFDPLAIDLELYKKHYENFIRTLNEGRKVTAFFNLNSADIQALMTPDILGALIKDFRSQVFFRHKGEVTHCRLDSVVDYKPGQNTTTKVILVTDVDNTFINSQVAYLIKEITNNVQTLPSHHANGCIYLNSLVWNDARNRTSGQGVTGATTYHGIGATGGASINVPYTIERAFLFFDTSVIPDGATIHEAYLDIYKLSGHYSQEVTLFEGTQGVWLMPSDFQHYGSVELGETVAGNLGFRRITLNAAGLALINKTGWTQYCLRETAFDVANIPPEAVYPTFRTYFTAAPVTYINKLTVKYTV